MSSYRCKLHSNCEFPDGPPEGSVEFGIGNRKRGSTFKFPDGTIHHLVRAIAPSALRTTNHLLSQHTRWHVNRNRKKDGCSFCFPDIQSAETSPTI